MIRDGKIIWNELRVLVVDDLKMARRIVCDMLKRLGVKNISEAEDGKKALEFIQTTTEALDLVLCDWDMPNLNGFEFFERFVKIYPNQAFVMITARNDVASVRQAKDVGIGGYLVKPFNVDEMEDRLTKVLLRKAASKTQ